MIVAKKSIFAIMAVVRDNAFQREAQNDMVSKLVRIRWHWTGRCDEVLARFYSCKMQSTEPKETRCYCCRDLSFATHSIA